MSKSTRLQQGMGIIRLARPLVLVSTFSSWLLGVAIAFGLGYGFNWISFALGFLSMLLVSSSIHFINEYADYETDLLTQRTSYSGGSGVLASGLIPRKWALYSALVTAVIGYLVQSLAIYLGFHPWQTKYIISIGAIGGWIYSLPPKLAWRGLGEIWNTLLGAWLLPFFGFVQISKTVDLEVLTMVLPVTFFAFNNLLAVTWPDREADRKVGKNTLATKLDPQILKMLHLACTILSFVFLLIIELPLLVFKSSLIAYPVMLLGFLNYTRSEISVETIFALHLLITVQIITWTLQGVRIV